MDFLVFEELRPPTVALAAFIAGIRPFSRVCLNMRSEVLPLHKTFAALLTLVRPLPSMNALVDEQGCSAAEDFAAIVAQVRLFASLVTALMFQQV
uniref:Uncharacterized protein n=1 Tax=Pyxicephalus adspersus TaxID=30357 RepID=A0AAV3ALH2_PYXAD|nr:TPA: hypothetical protein GDO54_000082 [Pyxicephalus adspersus]